ncbi:hypothetical protein PUR34_31210 [Streptomyces sp. JV185]|uniref:hypothetical protein n=1 Tax=Streptomyces sp. JV185 TaxID=858638 RepID=UPI002E79D89A|nr:hypothetical protein [Streptomyces sp. JV185]MEE1772506.1 hypothetical protein [Streptomyces sp. JV185]
MRQKAYAQAMRVIACALMVWQVWMMWYISSHEAVGVKWSCDLAGGCASDQLASLSPMLGIAFAVALGLLSARYLHRAAPGAMIALSAVERSTVTSFHIFLPLGDFSVSQWLTFLWSAAGMGCLAAWWGAAVSLRRTGGLRRLSRRYITADAVIEGWRSAGRKYGEVTVVFDDAAGVRHEVPAVVERVALRRDVLALYDADRPDDPAHTRVVVPRRKVLRLS